MVRRGRPAKVDREKLAQTAAELGITNLTLEQVASRLNVTLQTLYNHVRDREELLTLAAEALEKRHILPSDTGMNWIDWWRVSALSLKEFYDRTPGLASVLMTRRLLNVPPRLEPWEVGQVAAERFGFSPVMGHWANLALHEFVYSWCARRENLAKVDRVNSTPKVDITASAPRFSKAVLLARSLPDDLRFKMNLEALLQGLSSFRNQKLEDLAKPPSAPRSSRLSTRRRKDEQDRVQR